MRGHPDDELQKIHPLQLYGVTKNMVVSMSKDQLNYKGSDNIKNSIIPIPQNNKPGY
jgi:hypothetical protein